MTRQYERLVDMTMPELAAVLARFEALATDHLESMDEMLHLSRDIVLKSQERLAMLKLREDRRWR